KCLIGKAICQPSELAGIPGGKLCIGHPPKLDSAAGCLYRHNAIIAAVTGSGEQVDRVRFRRIQFGGSSTECREPALEALGTRAAMGLVVGDLPGPRTA